MASDAADVLHGDAEAVGLVVIDLELDLRRLELQVAVGEDEEAALGGFRLHLGEHLRQLRVVRGGGDDELHRRAAGRARQRRQGEGDRLRAGDAGDLGLQALQDLFLRALALVPGLEQDAGEWPGARCCRSR